MLLAILLACSTHVTIQSAADDRVSLVRGRTAETGITLATGEGTVSTRVPYVVGRRWWAVATSDGETSVVRVPSQPKGGPIVACTAGVLLAWPAAVGCLYVGGPTSRTITVPAAGQD